MTLALAALLTACRSSGDAGGAPSIEFHEGLFAVVGEGAPAGGEARLRLRTEPGVARMNVIITQFDFDGARMRLKACEIDRAVGEGTAAGKQLLSLEQSPGTVRAIVTGSAEPMPGDTEIFSCSFLVAPDAPAGPVQIRVQGDASDTDFADHAFKDEIHLVVRE